MLHVAAALDPKIKGERIQAWGHSINWDEVLDIMRELYPKEKWVADFVSGAKLSITTDTAVPLALLKKWGNQDGYKTVRDTVAESVDVYLKWYPRK